MSEYVQGARDYMLFRKAQRQVWQHTPRFDIFMGIVGAIGFVLITAAGLAERSLPVFIFGCFPWGVMAALVFSTDFKQKRWKYEQAKAYMEEYLERMRSETSNPHRT